MHLRKVTALFMVGIFICSAHLTPLLAEDENSFPENSNAEDQKSFFDSTALVQNAGLAAAAPVRDSRITLELKGVDVLDVLKILSTRSGLNIVAGKNVRGQVTIYLKDVLIRDALDTIITTLGLAYIESKGILQVMSDQEYEAIYGRSFGEPQVTKTFKIRHAMPAAINQMVQQLKSPKGKIVLDERTNTLIVSDRPSVIKDMERAVENLDEPLETKVFRLNYSQVADLETRFQEYLTPQNGVLKIDKRSNQISVTDRHEKVSQIGDIIRALDVKPSQVLIEAQIIEVSLFDAFRYGIDWDYVRRNVGEFDSINIQPAFDLTTPSSTVGSGTLSTFTVDTDRGLAGLNTVISVLQNIGKTNTLSAPRVTVLNNEEAKLVDATKQPYVSQTVVQGDTTSQTADNIQFVDVGVTLSVVPTISDEKTVVLKLKPEVSAQNGSLSVSGSTTVGTGSFTRTSIPIVATQTLETTVIIKTGETLIVGGLIKDSQTKTVRKLPFFGDLPILGSLFRSETVDFHKTELVIFLTPHIISGDTTSQEHEKFFDSKGDLIDFDQVGGYDYALGQAHSQGPLRLDNKPYWNVKRLEFPRYWYPQHLHSRSIPYQDRRNKFEGLKEGDVIPEEPLLRMAYEESLAAEVIASLQSIEVLHDLKGQIDLALKIRRDGVLEDVSFIDQGEIKNPKLRRQILQTIRNAGPFTEFPKGLDTQEELFDLRLQFNENQNQTAESADTPLSS